MIVNPLKLLPCCLILLPYVALAQSEIQHDKNGHPLIQADGKWIPKVIQLPAVLSDGTDSQAPAILPPTPRPNIPSVKRGKDPSDVVIGEDNRQLSPDVYPYTTVVRLFIGYVQNGTFVQLNEACTASIVGHGAVAVTAKHCIPTKAQLNGFPFSMYIRTHYSMNGRSTTNTGDENKIWVTNTRQGSYEVGASSYLEDWAVLELEKNAGVGALGYRSWDGEKSDKWLRDFPYHNGWNAGYGVLTQDKANPSNKVDDDLQRFTQSCQWTYTAGINAPMIVSECDTQGGNSGGPLVAEGNQQVGIMSYSRGGGNNGICGGWDREGCTNVFTPTERWAPSLKATIADAAAKGK